MVRNFFVWLFAVVGVRLLIWTFVVPALVPLLVATGNLAEVSLKAPLIARRWGVYDPGLPSDPFPETP